MATKTQTESPISPNDLVGECRHLQWTLNNGDDGTPVSFAEFSDKSVQVSGTFGVGGSVQMEGSNDVSSPSNWSLLTDPQGNSIVKTATSLEQILEQTVWIRPKCTAGDGTTAIVVKLLVRRGRGRAF